MKPPNHQIVFYPVEAMAVASETSLDDRACSRRHMQAQS
jgi:hypothetical protein